MNEQLTLNLNEGLSRKREGIARAASHAPTFHSIMRAVAIQKSIENGSVCSDEMRIYAQEHGIIAPNKNHWGPIFSGKCWLQIDERSSQIPSNHGHKNRVWKYVPSKGAEE